MIAINPKLTQVLGPNPEAYTPSISPSKALIRAIYARYAKSLASMSEKRLVDLPFQKNTVWSYLGKVGLQSCLTLIATVELVVRAVMAIFAYIASAAIFTFDSALKALAKISKSSKIEAFQKRMHKCAQTVFKETNTLIQQGGLQVTVSFVATSIKKKNIDCPGAPKKEYSKNTIIRRHSASALNILPLFAPPIIPIKDNNSKKKSAPPRASTPPALERSLQIPTRKLNIKPIRLKPEHFQSKSSSFLRHQDHKLKLEQVRDSELYVLKHEYSKSAFTPAFIQYNNLRRILGIKSSDKFFQEVQDAINQHNTKVDMRSHMERAFSNLQLTYFKH